jgi:hypothetical protein
VSDWLCAEADSMLLQFQDQIEDLRRSGDPQLAVAAEHFESMPPVGLLPIGGASDFGFHYLEFFTGLTVRNPVFVEGGRLDALIRSSFAYPPIDLASGNVVWLYVVRENVQAADEGSPRQEFMVFASGLMPFEGNAQFDLSHWDYANYSMRLA